MEKLSDINDTDVCCKQGRQDRLQYMDILKFAAIFLVVWGHSEQYLLTSDFPDRAVYRHIYSFHMPLFMMISGFFFAMTLKPGIMKNVLNKARQLILPALCWGFIYVLIQSLTNMSSPSLKYIGLSIFNGFWFLHSAFACSLLAVIPCVVMRKQFFAGIIVTLLISQIRWFNPVINLGEMYMAFAIGIMVFRYHGWFRSNWRWIVPICGVAWIICNLFLDADAYRCMKGMVDGFSRNWKIYRYFMGVTGAVAWIGLFEIIFGKQRNGKIISMVKSWGSLTLGIYVLQAFLLDDYIVKVINLDSIPGVLFDFVVSPIVSLIIMSVSVAVIHVIQRNKYASFFLLGTRWPETSHVGVRLSGQSGSD